MVIGSGLGRGASRRLAIAIVAVCAACATAAGAATEPQPLDAIRVDPATGQFIDRHGRVRVFRGVNVVWKEFPWYPPSEGDLQNTLSTKDMEDLRSWGFNVVRLGVMWPGVEPAPGQINATYLGEIRRIASELAAHGIYTLVDLHQDLLSRHFCGEGVPEFYVEDLLRNQTSAVARSRPFPLPYYEPLELDADGFPNITDCVENLFSTYYFTEKVGATFRELYTPGSPLNKGFLNYWGNVSQAFANDTPHILGYELLNEPSPQCLDAPESDIQCEMPDILTGNIREYYAPLYRAAAERIRVQDPDRPIFYEAQPAPVIKRELWPEPVLGHDTQQGLAYHIYCTPDDDQGRFPSLICSVTQDLYENEYWGFLEQKNRSIAGFMSEFGAVGPTPLALEHLERLMAAADEHFVSWAYWQLKFYRDFTTANKAESLYNHKGQLEKAKLSVLSRSYAQAVAGTPVNTSFTPGAALGSAVFKLEYIAAKGSGVNTTEIYLNEALHYPWGYDVKLSPKCVALKAQPNRLLLEVPDRCAGETIALMVFAKAAPTTRMENTMWV